MIFEMQFSFLKESQYFTENKNRAEEKGCSACSVAQEKREYIFLFKVLF